MTIRAPSKVSDGGSPLVRDPHSRGIGDDDRTNTVTGIGH
jgi:hypothetical protein